METTHHLPLGEQAAGRDYGPGRKILDEYIVVPPPFFNSWTRKWKPRSSTCREYICIHIYIYIYGLGGDRLLEPPGPETRTL